MCVTIYRVSLSSKMQYVICDMIQCLGPCSRYAKTSTIENVHITHVKVRIISGRYYDVVIIISDAMLHEYGL